MLLLEGSVLYDVGTVATVFAPPLSPQSPRPDLGYELVNVSVDGRPVRLSQGMEMSVDAGLEGLDGAGLVIVPGATPSLVAGQTAALDALRASHAAGARVMSICTGAFVLAQAGLLDGRRATTHWGYAAEFAARYPQVELDPDVLYIDDGDVMTSAGLQAGMDLCLHVVRSDLGSDSANVIARWNVVAPHRDGGQAQFISAPVPPSVEGGLAATREWVLERLDRALTVEDMARHAHVSERTFARRFVEETGFSPKRWLNQQRIEHARRLLESTDLPIEHVAQASGFGSAAVMRVHFERATATRPSAYRAAFRAA